jgi:hypothetical protein
MSENLIDALQALIFYVDRVAPDLPDNASTENLAIALDRARAALERAAA